MRMQRRAFFEKALGQSSPRPDAMDYDINYYLATAYYRNGQVDKAIHVYQAITDLKPGEKDRLVLKSEPWSWSRAVRTLRKPILIRRLRLRRTITTSD